jgi:predicted 3-demethylubiquinone-9 3-methyltransferase (glyoxalase superfamily)
LDAFTTCLWFDTQGEEAAKFYTSIFPNSSVGLVTPYPSGEQVGQTMTVDFVLNGSKFVDELLARSDPAQAERVTQALFQMKKIVIADLEAAAAA